MSNTTSCPVCNGTGDAVPVGLFSEKCEECNGGGWLPLSRFVVVSPTQKPPAHPFYGDSYARGIDPMHISCAPHECADSPCWHRGEAVHGWFLLDAYGQEIGWVADGTRFLIQSGEREVPGE